MWENYEMIQTFPFPRVNDAWLPTKQQARLFEVAGIFWDCSSYKIRVFVIIVFYVFKRFHGLRLPNNMNLTIDLGFVVQKTYKNAMGNGENLNKVILTKTTYLHNFLNRMEVQNRTRFNNLSSLVDTKTFFGNSGIKNKKYWDFRDAFNPLIKWEYFKIWFFIDFVC